MSTDHPDRGRTVGAILVGGASRRFGSAKGLAELGGEPIVERIVATHRQVLSEVVLIVAALPSPYDHLGVPTIADSTRGVGPLAGLQAALAYALTRDADGVCCTSGDTPFLSAPLLSALLQARPGMDVVVPEGPRPGQLQPLCAWYSTRVLPEVERCLASGEYALHALVGRIGSRRILPVAELDCGDASHLFHNVNTPEDLWAAEGMLRGRS